MSENVTLPVSGMTCAGCARTIERTLQRVPGVEQASVNFATNRAAVLVQGGYSPAVVRAKRGRPLRLRFNRQEDGTCSDIIVFPEFGIRRDLPAFRTTQIELVPDQVGEFTFACGMNMLRGKLMVSD